VHGIEGEAGVWGQPVSGCEKKKREGGEVSCCRRLELGRWAGDRKLNILFFLPGGTVPLDADGPREDEGGS
jgi:hypothetical protein